MVIRWVALAFLLLTRREYASCFSGVGRHPSSARSTGIDAKTTSTVIFTKNAIDLEEEEFVSFSAETTTTDFSDDDVEDLSDAEELFSTSTSFSERNKQWLEEGTKEILDLEKFPLGSLTVDDVETIAGIMTAWARRKSVDAALIVEKLLKRVVDDMRAGNKSIHVTTRHYTMAIDAWAKSGQQGVAQRAQHIHDGMIEMHNRTRDRAIAPSNISYNTLINAWAKTGGDPDVAVQMAEKAFCAMLDIFKETGNFDLKPDAVTFSSLIDCYGRCKKDDRTKRAQELFDMMDDMNVKKNVYSYSALQVVYSRSSLADAADRTMAVLQQMLDAYEKKADVLAKPNVINFNAMLSAFCNTPEEDAVDKAEEMLRRMEMDVSEGGYDVEPDRLSYALTVFTAAKCPNQIKGAERAEAILERMEARSKEEEKRRKEISSAAPASVKLDFESFNCALRAMGQIGAVDRAMAIIERMEKYANEGHESVRPNVRSWNMVLNAHSRSRQPDAAQRAHDILNRMKEMHQSGQNTKPDIYSYAAVLAAYQKSVQPEKGDNLVRQMEKLYEQGEIDAAPDVYHYTIVCATWAKSGHKMAPSRCGQILNHMIQRHQEGYPAVKPNTRTYNAVVDCLSRGKLPEQAEQLLYYMLNLYKQGDADAAPDVFTFNQVISAWTRTKKRGSGKRAEAILERLIEYSEDENREVLPDARCFNHIIGYYRFSRDKAPDFPYRAEYLLNRMLVLYKQTGYSGSAPNNFSFESVIEVFAYSKNHDAGEAADRLLKVAKRLCAENDLPDLKPDSVIMNAVMHAWSLSGHEDAGERSDVHLEEMESLYAAGVKEMQPETRNYGLVLSSWARSEKNDKMQRALAVIRRMEEQERQGNKKVKLNEHACGLVINTCAFTPGTVREQRNAFFIALSIFDRMIDSENLQPSSLTYGWFIEAAGRLSLPFDLKEANIERAFDLCCKNGKLSNFILDRLRRSASGPLYKKLLAPAIQKRADRDQVQKPRIITSQLPRKWSKNNRNNQSPQLAQTR